jgi:hypothetical protein
MLRDKTREDWSERVNRAREAAQARRSMKGGATPTFRMPGGVPREGLGAPIARELVRTRNSLTIAAQAMRGELRGVEPGARTCSHDRHDEAVVHVSMVFCGR